MTINVENINKVADAIERHTIPNLGFNMGAYLATTSEGDPDLSGHRCGTVACIAGWTCAVAANGMPAHETVDGAKAARFLGISDDERMSLFMPSGWLSNRIRPAQAVRVLRHLAKTGEVDWSVANA